MGHMGRGGGRKPITLKDSWDSYNRMTLDGLAPEVREFIRCAFYAGATALHHAQLQCGKGLTPPEHFATLIQEIDQFTIEVITRTAANEATEEPHDAPDHRAGPPRNRDAAGG